MSCYPRMNVLPSFKMNIYTQSSILIELESESPPIQENTCLEKYQVASAIIPKHQDTPCNADCPLHKNIYPETGCLLSLLDEIFPLFEINSFKEFSIPNVSDIGYTFF